jgi:SAM-dependent methyltransferase
MKQSKPGPTDEAYGEVAALRYNEFESRATGFALRAAPHIAAFYANRSISSINPSVLDIGCGTGQLASYLLDRGIPVTGIDPSEHMLRYAFRNNAGHVTAGRARFLIMEGSTLSLAESFGLTVATFNTLNHLPSHEHLRRCLERLYQATAPGGYFLFDIDTRRGLQRTAELAELSETDDETTLRIRRFDGERLILYATGWFMCHQRRYSYRETIAKIVIDTEALRRTLEAVGWSSLSYTTDDYSTPVENAEDGVRAYGVARRGGG